jgi:predicted PurR-regulated permease PerM
MAWKRREAVRHELDGPGEVAGGTAAKDETPQPWPVPDPTPVQPSRRVLTIASVGILILGILYTLYFARTFLLPISIAILLNFLLSPAVRVLKRLRLPDAAGAALVVLGLVGLSAVGIYEIAGPAQQWLAKAPAVLRQAEAKLHPLRAPVEQVKRAAENVEQAASDTGGQPQEVVVRGPTLGARLFGFTQSVVTASLGIVVLLYFLLAAGDLFTLKLVRVLPQFGDKRIAVSIINETEASISRYLVTVAAVNIGQGVVVGLVMFLLGMPNAPLWGALSAAAEFIPYLGAMAVVVILTLAGLVTFDAVGHALLVPGAYLVVNLLQSQVVTPMVLGHRLELNPVAVFVGLAFWLWVWGLPGAFIAVPMLATLKICCDHIERLEPLGEFLGQ